MVLFLFLQVSIESNLKVEFAYPSVNLAALDPGFLNPASGHGLVGMVANPAAVNDLKNGEFFISVSPSLSTNLRSNFLIPIESIGSLFDTIDLPVDFSFQDHGHLDFIGFALRRGKWSFGLGIMRGDYLKIDLNGNADLHIEHEIEFSETLTHELIESLPPGEQIPVLIRLSGMGDAGIDVSGFGRIKSTGIILNSGVHEAGLDLGFGLQVEPVFIDAELSGNLTGGLKAAAEAPVQSQSSDWLVDAQFSGEVHDDSLITGSFKSHLSGFLIRFSSGVKKNFRFLDLGLSYQYLLPTKIKGSYNYYYLYPDTIPEILIDDDSLIVDTINHRISGTGKIIIRDFPKQRDEAEADLTNPIGKAHGLYAGATLKLFFLRLGLFGGGLAVPDGSYLRLILGGNLGLKIFIPIEGTVVYSYQALRVGDLTITALPVIGANVGTNFKIKNLHLYFGLGVNSTLGAASFLLPEILEGKKTSENIVTIRTGLGYEF
ncbi:MAG TPA: hypothetical protein EYP24_04640 [bacterium (Candidatus Stahlbacteria)]|nr:hypothetical protein [Candidatus Stahlbacteria bacterium]